MFPLSAGVAWCFCSLFTASIQVETVLLFGVAPFSFCLYRHVTVRFPYLQRVIIRSYDWSGQSIRTGQNFEWTPSGTIDPYTYTKRIFNRCIPRATCNKINGLIDTKLLRCHRMIQQFLTNGEIDMKFTKALRQWRGNGTWFNKLHGFVNFCQVLVRWVERFRFCLPPRVQKWASDGLGGVVN